MSNEIIDPEALKKHSEELIINVGGEILDWLPALEVAETRSDHEVINRALILNAMYQLCIKAPKYIIHKWIVDNVLVNSLTPFEASILNSLDTGLTEKEAAYLSRSLESLWAIAWATNLIKDLPYNQPIGDELASLSPDLKSNEDGKKYLQRMKLRSKKSLYEMRDLYFRVRWWVGVAMNKDTSIPEAAYIVACERLKALEWITDRNIEWDHDD